MPLFPRSVLFPPSLAFDFSLWGTFPPSLSSAVSRCFLDGTWALQSASETHRCLSVVIPTWSPQRALCCGTDLCPPPARSLLCADDYRSVLRLLGHRAKSSCEPQGRSYWLSVHRVNFLCVLHFLRLHFILQCFYFGLNAEGLPSISCRVGLQAMNSLCFCLSRNDLVSA